jgi:hypothetical protein
MSEPTVVDARLDKLEHDNRRLKLTLGALLLVLAAVPLIGAVMPEQIPDTVRARNFFVYDGNGNVRAVMDDSSMRYRDEIGNIRAVMDDSSIRYRDENGNIVWSTDCAPNC